MSSAKKTTTKLQTGPRAGDRLLYVADVAEILGRDSQAIHHMLRTGKAPKSALVAGKRAFWESDVTAWLEEQFAAAA